MSTRGRWLLLAGLLGTGGFTAKETGALELLIPKGAAAQSDRRLTNIERKLEWLVLQEVRRQAREGVAIDPPEDAR